VARISWRQLAVLNACWVGLSFMWNSLHGLVLPAMLLAWVPESRKNTYLGLLTFAGLVIAMAVQPLSGALCDGWRSRWGRRRPLMAAGTLVDLAWLGVLGWAGGLPALAAGYLGLQISSNLAHGPAQGLLPDQVPARQWGAASGVKNLFDMAGLVAASLLVGRLLPPGEERPTAAVAVIAGVLAASTAVTLAGAREAPSQDGPALDWRQRLGQAWRLETRAQPAFWRVVASRFVFLLGIYGIQTFALFYVRDVLRPDDPARLTGDLLAVIALTLMALALAGGWLCDRLGARRVQAAAGLLAGLGCLLLTGARTPGLLLAFGSVVGAGIGLFLTANWTLANRLAPRAEAGRYLGLTNLATAGAGAIGRLEGPLLDALNGLQPGAFWGYSFLFLFGAAAALGSLALLPREAPPSPEAGAARLGEAGAGSPQP
jgi:MFS family permease